MAANYSTKTAISIYQFNSEDEYRQWLGANKTKSNDIIAFVKNPYMNNGLDIFINGHSISKTRFFLWKDGGAAEITSSSTFDPSKQYLIKSISRNGLGEKQMVTLEEIDLDAIHRQMEESILTSAQQMMDDKIDNYMEEHPIEIDPNMFNVDAYNKILTHNHYILRKLFSLIYKATDNPINMDATLVDNVGNMYTTYDFAEGSNATVGGVIVNITGAEGYDVTYSQLLVIDTYGNILKRVDGRRLTQGRNDIMLDNILTLYRTSTISIKLGYTINNWPSSYKNSITDNFDKPIEIGTLNKTGVTDMVTKEIEVVFRTPDDGPSTPASASAFFLISIPSSIQESVLNNWETIDYLTSSNVDSNIKICKTTDITALRLTPSSDSWMYVALPFNMQGILQIQAAGGFPDTLTQRINTGNYNGKLYALYKEDFAQDAALTYKVVYDE